MPSVAPSLTVPLRRSRRLLVVLCTAHALAGASVMSAVLPGAVAAALLAAVGASLAFALRREWPSALVLHGDGTLETVSAAGAPTPARVHPHTVALGGLVVLLYRQEGRIRSVPLLSDCFATAEDFRELRVWLRHRVAPAEASAG